MDISLVQSHRVHNITETYSEASSYVEVPMIFASASLTERLTMLSLPSFLLFHLYPSQQRFAPSKTPATRPVLEQRVVAGPRLHSHSLVTGTRPQEAQIPVQP